MTESRQVRRRKLFDVHFKRYLCDKRHSVPKDMPSRKERRQLARAYAVGEWRRQGAAA